MICRENGQTIGPRQCCRNFKCNIAMSVTNSLPWAYEFPTPILFITKCDQTSPLLSMRANRWGGISTASENLIEFQTSGSIQIKSQTATIYFEDIPQTHSICITTPNADTKRAPPQTTHKHFCDELGTTPYIHFRFFEIGAFMNLRASRPPTRPALSSQQLILPGHRCI